LTIQKVSTLLQESDFGEIKWNPSKTASIKSCLVLALKKVTHIFAQASMIEGNAKLVGAEINF
jgi:hypothetical protein